jgi:beta-galactosidase
MTVESEMGGSHTFPPATPDWSNIEVLHRNTLPPRASFFVYDNVKDALRRDVSKSRTFSLSGTWKFDLAKGPYVAPPDFFERDFDAAEWSDIKVPGMWQMQGYGKGPH